MRMKKGSRMKGCGKNDEHEHKIDNQHSLNNGHHNVKEKHREDDHEIQNASASSVSSIATAIQKYHLILKQLYS